MTITKAPVILGDGIPLFGKLNSPVTLTDVKTKDYPNGFAQLNYKVTY